MISVLEARQAIIERAQTLPAERIAVAQAAGRYLSSAVCSPIDLPPFDNSAMDGYALRLAELNAAGSLPIKGVCLAGSAPAELAPNTAMRIFTGAPVPVGADTVVIQEDVIVDGQRLALKIGESYRLGENIRSRGHELAAGSVWFASGHQLGAADCGLLAAMGLAELYVTRRPRVALLATGDELIAPGTALQPGQIYNSNQALLLNILAQLGCEVVSAVSVADHLAATRTALLQAAEQADVVLSTGGVSVGEADYVKEALTEIGELNFWKIAVKPGKPLAFGRVAQACFFGLPGNPVSAYVTFMLFVWPYLQALCTGKAACELAALPCEPAIGDFAWPRAGKREEFLRVTAKREGGQLRVSLLPNQSSGALSSVALADGFVRVPIGVTWQAGATLEFIAKPF